MKPRGDCPGCGSRELHGRLALPPQPVVLNYRFPTPAAARSVPRRPVVLGQCRACGLVFNRTFDPDVIPYDERYENRQSFSPAFRQHLDALATRLTTRYPWNHRRLLEVGCGKGEFLVELCRRSGARGDGYDTSYEGPSSALGGRVHFAARYLTPADVRGPYDFVLCRHVVEHVPGIGPFLQTLAEIARAAGDPVVVIETPRFEWIVENRCLWDVFYEHCNYFSEATLAHLCRRAGLRVVAQRAVFGGQYQLLELRLRRRPAPVPPPRLPPAARLEGFARDARQQLSRLAGCVRRESRGAPWAIWGAGAKGVALANLLPRLHPACVIDSNPAKAGCVIPGTDIPVVGPDAPGLDRVGLIVIANPNYAAEIGRTLQARGFRGRTLIL